MPKNSAAERRFFVNQALATTRIEGHVPSAEFLADCEAYVAGRLTTQQMRATILARTPTPSATEVES
jgi:Antitoxin VbhA